MSRLVVLLCSAAAAVSVAACAPATAPAATPVGVAVQDYGYFPAPAFEAIGWQRVRYIASWNVALKSRERRYLTRYLRAADDAGLEVFVSLNVAVGSRCPSRPCTLPSVRAYTKAFKAFRKRFPSVEVISPWNEVNHRSQPTFRNPRRAAEYYNVARRYCAGCTIVAADVIDERNMVSWLSTFKRYAIRPRIWGLHNYRDTNPRPGQLKGGTRKLLRAVRGQVWLTETGGIVYFKLPEGNVLFPRDERRADRALKTMFSLAKRYRSRIKRIYIYDWSQPRDANRFDAGLVRKDGTPRPGYKTVKKQLSGASFSP